MTGKELFLARERLNLTRQQVATLLLVAASTVHRWEASGCNEIKVEPRDHVLLLYLLGVSSHPLALAWGQQLRRSVADEPPGHGLFLLLSFAFDGRRDPNAS